MRQMQYHDWYDNDIHQVEDTSSNTVELVFYREMQTVAISRDDAIELAKYFGLVVYEKNSFL